MIQHVLCYEHHSQMRLSRILLRIGEKSWQITAYVCDVPGCFARYNHSRGYFSNTSHTNEERSQALEA